MTAKDYKIVERMLLQIEKDIMASDGSSIAEALARMGQELHGIASRYHISQKTKS